ncbi:MAG: hypothetical protein IJR88_01120 [Clostridia bacterium]|nr:hypothetical protein [Clostridia bacterium]
MERELLFARLADALEKCDKGILATLGFLTPGEHLAARRRLESLGRAGDAFFFGGYDTAERVCLFLLPEYLSGLLTEGDFSKEQVLPLLGEALEENLFAIRITGSGFRTLSHRDYLGSILALGVERDSFGDIALQNDHEAVVFATRSIGKFLLENLTRVGADAVKCTPYTLDAAFTDGRRYEPIHDTVASPRLDCVVAALTNSSREETARLIEAGLVEVDFEEATRKDLLLTPPASISVRGHGRYRLLSFDGETRKGRLRMIGDRLV